MMEGDVGESIEEKEGVVRNEKHHGVLPDEANKRRALQGQCQEESRYSHQGAEGVDACSPWVLHELVETHVIFSVPHAVAHHKLGYEQ